MHKVMYLVVNVFATTVFAVGALKEPKWMNLLPMCLFGATSGIWIANIAKFGIK
jgi:hypothetical protein